MEIYLQRAQLLLAQNRLEEAEKEVRKALSMAPQDPWGIAMLAEICVQGKRYEEALEYARQAVAQMPNAAWLYVVLGRILLLNQKSSEAADAVREGLRLDPTLSGLYEIKSLIAFYKDDWEGALEAAEQGLTFDPEEVDLINLRVQALVKLNRRGEAAETIHFALHHNPENPYSHASKGWVEIEHGHYDAAVSSFREALRFDPTNEYARSGLKEAIKGKNWLYRGLLRYFLWVAKLSQRNQWMLIIGLYLAYQFTIYVASQAPALQPFLTPLIVAYIVFAFSSWIARPVSNLFLQLHPLGKHALSEDERHGATAIGLLLLGALIFGLTFLFTQNLFFGKLAGMLVLMLIPVSGRFSVNPETKARKSLTYYVLGLAITGLAGVFANADGATTLFLIGLFGFSWVANYLIQKEARKF